MNTDSLNTQDRSRAEARPERALNDPALSALQVSVLMAVYNGAAYLEEAIDSVLAQTLRNFELILVDDGSTDQSPEIMARYAEQDTQVVVYRQENQGISGAMNQALRLARASYIAILDSDDIMAPERLAVQAAYLDRHAEIAAVGSQWFTINTQSSIRGIDRHPTDPASLFTLMFAYFAMHHPTIMARKEPILACGAYDHIARQGCRDYTVFLNLLLAGHRMTNLPEVLTRWRLNPGSVTHSKARQQTENCIDIRAHAFQKLDLQDRDCANQVALDLVRTFPAGSWFDEKVAALIPDAQPSPALLRWRELAAHGFIPELEVACVDWLHDEQDHAASLAGLLTRDGMPWLGQLVLGQSGGGRIADKQNANSLPVSPVSRELALLIPTHANDGELNARVRSGLDALPENAEMIVFSTDGSTADLTVALPDSRLRIFAPSGVGGQAWRQAFAETGAGLIACLAAGSRHHSAFLTQSMTALHSDRHCALVYAPADQYYADALDSAGNAIRDPSPEPRWTRQTLLGKDRASLSCMVFRRERIGAMPIVIEETGPAADWAIARSLLVSTEPLILPLRNTEFVSRVGISNNIMEVLIRRLVARYLDTGLGSIPIPQVWLQWPLSQGRKQLQELDARWREQRLCIYPGNASLLANFIVHFSRMPFFHRVFRCLLMQYPAIVLHTLRKRSVLAANLGVFGHLLLRAHSRARKVIRQEK